MTLTNVTFSDSGNKALLCSYRKFMRTVVVQLQSSSEELRQVSATILRNLSWHADTASRDVLREVGAVAGLVKAAMVTTEENTLRCILSALWNLSAHSTENKAEICAIEGALAFLVKMLSYQSTSESFAIIENAGGVLRNISSQIAVRDDYREVLRKHNCLQMLLEHLKSRNMTILNNVCGIIWNLSAKCVVDQDALIKSGAVDLLSSLTTSKHKMIALSSSAALRNLLHSVQKRADARHGEGARILHKHQDFILNNIDASTICDESLFFENIYEYIPMSDLKRKYETQKKLNLKKNENYSRKTEDSELCQGFQSMSITNQNYQQSKPKYLPPAPKSITSSPSTFIPVRNKFSDFEIENGEQPIDYSRKYSDKVTKTYYGTAKSVKGDKNSGMYAETDLDQPTDYSLQYAEDDSDSDCDKVSKNEGEEFVQDTIKTYCTEGTPYETPFNFSTATSMSDLRVETSDKTSVKERDDVVEASNREFKENTDTGLVKSFYSPGLMSPEKPVTYCEEGTPGYFSRVSSLSSLAAFSTNDGVKENDQSEKAAGTSAMKPTNKMSSSPGETKVVKFELNYAEETPLMFSRSSSLASLDSIEQHSIRDDRSSVISDFSRRTSGMVSPSELPDSPTQMVPPSPKTAKTVAFTMERNRSDEDKSFNHRIIPKPTVFDDKMMKFKDENTPIHFSAATSLSSLTIDDHEEGVNQEIPTSTVEIEQENNVVENNIVVDLLEQDDENDDEILAACIKMGMPSKRFFAHILFLFIFSIMLIFRSQKQDKSSSQCDIRSISTPSKTEVEDRLSDVSSNLSEDDNKILAECIQAGMQKSRNTASSLSNGYFENGRKYGSLKKNKDGDSSKQNNKMYLRGCSSHETGLNNKGMTARVPPIFKSSSSDCTDDRVVIGLAR